MLVYGVVSGHIIADDEDMVSTPYVRLVCGSIFIYIQVREESRDARSPSVIALHF